MGAGGTGSQVVDLTDETTAINIRRGRDLTQDRFNPGLCTIRVLDPNGDWNPQNPASPYFGLLQPQQGPNQIIVLFHLVMFLF